MMNINPKKKKLRKVGDILQDMEPLLLELVDHELQWGEILALTHSYLMIHAPGMQEEYEDNTNPVYYYGVKK